MDEFGKGIPEREREETAQKKISLGMYSLFWE